MLIYLKCNKSVVFLLNFRPAWSIGLFSIKFIILYLQWITANLNIALFNKLQQGRTTIFET